MNGWQVTVIAIQVVNAFVAMAAGTNLFICAGIVALTVSAALLARPETRKAA